MPDVTARLVRTVKHSWGFFLPNNLVIDVFYYSLLSPAYQLIALSKSELNHLDNRYSL
jgi:hypothetical protein